MADQRDCCGREGSGTAWLVLRIAIFWTRLARPHDIWASERIAMATTTQITKRCPFDPKPLRIPSMRVFVMATGTASPQSTGGAGTVFEQHVGAMFLALLLIRGIPPIFQDCQVKEVIFQTRRLGWETDDLLVTCSSRNTTRKMAMQIKRRFTVGKSRGKETILGFWNDFNSDMFNPDRDALILVTLNSTENLGGLASLLGCARSSPNPADFKSRLKTPKFISNAARRCYRDIRSAVGSTDSTGNAKDENLWRFLRTMHVLFLDLTTNTAQQEATVKQWLALASCIPGTADGASATWRELVEVASDAATRARTLRRSDLPDGMPDRYDAMPSSVLQPLTDHSAIVLNGIYTTIGGVTTLPRTEVTAQVAMAPGNGVVILTGAPGSGKSALAKAIIKRHSDNHLCLSFRATEFAKSHIDDAMPGPISGEQFKIFVGAQESVTIYVDGLESLLDSSVRDAFNDLVDIIEECPNASLMLTCRDNKIRNAAVAFFGRLSLPYSEVTVPPLSASELEQVRKDMPSLEVPLSHPKLEHIMNTPYVLDMAAHMDWSNRQDIPADVTAFRKKWWSEVVRNDAETADGLPDRREQTLVDLAVRHARELRPLVPTNEMDMVALDKLHKDGIVLMGDGGLAAPAHDVIEDWAIIRWIESRASRHEWSALPMAGDVGSYPAVRRRFREWLKERLEANAEKTYRFASSAYDDDSLPICFQDDVLVSLLTSNYARRFIAQQKDRILTDNARLLVRFIRITQMACTKELEPNGGPAPKPQFIIPDGETWPALLEVIADSLDDLLPAHTVLILDLLERWSLGLINSPAPDGINPVGRIAYQLLERPDYEYKYGLRKRILKIIAQIPGADEDRFLDLLKRAPPDSKRHDALSDEFGRLLIDGMNGFPACRKFPEEMAQFIRSWCLMLEENSGSIPGPYDPSYAEYEFGLRAKISFDFFPNSALQGPFLALLIHSPDIGIQLILDIMNHAGDRYETRKGRGYWPGSRTEPVPVIISIPGKGNIRQLADDTLWLAYRGTSHAPNAIKCALMALEHRLLEMCENQDPVESLLFRILKGSNNVMTTAVVASVCCAHPTLASSVSLALLKSLEYVRLDRVRMAKEYQSADIATSLGNPLDRPYADERKKSNALPHRQWELRTLAIKMQFGEKKEQVWKVIDEHRVNIRDKDRTDEDRARLLMLHRMDIRRMKYSDVKPSTDGDNAGGEGWMAALTANTDKMDADLLRFYNAGAEENQQFFAALSLINWGLGQWKRSSGDKGAESWRQILASARGDRRYDAAQDIEYMLRHGLPVVAAVCVRDHWDDMDEEDRQWCADTLVPEIERDGDSSFLTRVPADTAGAEYAAFVIPSILARDPGNKRILQAVIQAVTHGSAKVSITAADGVAEYLGPQHRGLALRCAGAAAMLSNSLQYERQRAQGDQAEYDEKGNIRNQLERVRGAAVDGSVDTREELAKLDIKPQRGRNAACCIMPILGGAPDSPLAKNFFARVGQAVMDVWIAERENRGGHADFMLWDAVAARLADALLALPPDDIPYCCGSFLNAVDERPEKLARFVETLILRGEVASGKSSFWHIWRAIAGRIVDIRRSSDSSAHSPADAELVDKMLFNIGWTDDPRKLPLLMGNEDDVNRFVENLPATPSVLRSFTHYLYSVGDSALPEALAVVANRLQAGGMLDESAVFYLVTTLKRHMYDQSQSLKTDPTLRNATLIILDRLVEAGSSAAYKMRDDFTTPNEG